MKGIVRFLMDLWIEVVISIALLTLASFRSETAFFMAMGLWWGGVYHHYKNFRNGS